MQTNERRKFNKSFEYIWCCSTVSLSFMLES